MYSLGGRKTISYRLRHSRSQCVVGASMSGTLALEWCNIDSKGISEKFDRISPPL